MLKNRKRLIFAALLAAGLFMFIGPSHGPAYALTDQGGKAADPSGGSHSDDDLKIAKLCAQKLGVSQKSKNKEDQKVIEACSSGYYIGMSHPHDAGPCSDSYKGDKKAMNACASVGFLLGKSDPLKIGGSGKTAPKSPDDSECDGSACSDTPTGSGQNCDENHCDLVSLYVNPFIRLLSLIVGLVVAGSLVMAGVQYAASSGDSQKVSAAKSRISNTLLAFLAYAFLYAFLNFLIPGGLSR